MPDWSYRTFLRPLLLSLGAERARRISTSVLAAISRVPFGVNLIDFLGHMRPDERLRRRAGGVVVAGPMALGGMIDPGGEAVAAFSRFGAGLIELGPVVENPQGNAGGESRRWDVDLARRRVALRDGDVVVSAGDVERNLASAPSHVPLCIRLRGPGIERVAPRLAPHAAFVSVEAPEDVAAVAAIRPTILSISAEDPGAAQKVDAAMRAGAAGVWLRGDFEDVLASIRSMPPEAVVIAGGVTEPDEARRLLDAGATMAAVDAGLVCSGPGLIKRCNEALLSLQPPPEGEAVGFPREAWFWALLLGAAMFAGGVLALIIGATRVVLPYDEALTGMSRAQLASLNPRLLPFMAHDRVSLAGTMISIGIFYAALAWCGIRRGAHWAHVTVIASAAVGFLTFFFFLGFGYFDPFHAFVTAILTQFTLLSMVMRPSPPQPPVAEWRETAAWRRGQWGQLLFIVSGVSLTGAGLVISFIGCTEVFVFTDLAFMQTTAEQLHRSYERLIPLVAHDRASLGGMLIANGITVWLAAQWGFRAGARWLWMALAWGGNIAFACTMVVHLAVGYDAAIHLAPAAAGWLAWNVALALTKEWLAGGRNGAPASSPAPATR